MRALSVKAFSVSAPPVLTQRRIAVDLLRFIAFYDFKRILILCMTWLTLHRPIPGGPKKRYPILFLR